MRQIPNLQQAKALLDEAQALNPGIWVNHSIYVAKAARLISARCPSMDETVAYILGLLHDIGRRTGSGMRHVLDGYLFLMEQGFEDAARICMTHTFSYKDIQAIYGEWNCSAEELRMIKNYLNEVHYDDYDLLIQLCDSLVLPSGYSILEKRFVETVLKSGTNHLTVSKWKSVIALKDYFENKIGCSIYGLLPNIVENTFGEL
ncbi:MAG: HD domain-containing protein [Desulfosporosinus sp.]|nr:HD domain-containing protein [Desulfosporosinus sp.]